LPDAQAHHLVTVLRAKLGDRVDLTDGQGHKRVAEISMLAKRSASISFITSVETVPQPAVEITLFQCIAKPARMDWLIEKAQELGVKRLVPIISEYVQIKPKDSSIERWVRIAEAAITQCNSGYLMQIDHALTWKEALPLFLEQPTLLADLREHERTCTVAVNNLPSSTRKVGIIIGPEGDLSFTELAQAKENGAVPVTLGTNILRVETAALYAISAVEEAMANNSSR
jgi:16S rRNA (uracil1498-N3)-methyltransferase